MSNSSNWTLQDSLECLRLEHLEGQYELAAWRDAERFQRFRRLATAAQTKGQPLRCLWYSLKARMLKGKITEQREIAMAPAESA